MYVRNLRKPSANKNVYKFVSVKNRCTIICESSLEYECCYHLEYCDDVISYSSQPKGFRFSYRDKEHAYTPDFLVHREDGTSYLIEVKPLSKTFDPEFKDKFCHQQIRANELGTPLLLVTDRQIRNEIYLNNLKLIHRYSGCIENTSQLDLVLSAVNQSSPICIKALSERLHLTIGEVLSSVLRLIGLRKIKTSLDVALNENTLVKVA